MTLGALYDKYAERMALFASRSKACIELSNKYYSEHQDEVDKHIKAICHGEHQLQHILGLDTAQCRSAVICMACILCSDEDDRPEFARNLLSTYLKNTKKEKLPPIDEKALERLCDEIEAAQGSDKDNFIIAYNAFTQHKLNPQSRAFFPVYAPKYKKFESCSYAIYNNALLAMMLLGSINTTAKVRYMERYDYLYRTIVRPRFSAKSFGATWVNDSNLMRRKTGVEREEENVLQMPLIATLTTSGVMNQQRMDRQVLTKEMLMHIAVTAYAAANIDMVDAPLEKVWEAIDTGNESAYDDETIQIAKEKTKTFRTTLFNATYYTMLCEQTKKTVLDGLQDYFFNPQGTRLNNELKKCKRQMERDGEQLKQHKESLKEYRTRADTAERAAEDARNRYAGIQSKVESQQKQITDLEEQLKALREENARLRQQLPAQPAEEIMNDATTEPGISYEEELSRIFSERKIVFIGGHPNIMGKFAQKYPEAAVIEKDKAMTADKQLDGAAAVLFKTDSMGHKEYTPIKDLAGRKNVPVGYIKDVTSLSLVEQSVYEELKKLNISE